MAALSRNDWYEAEGSAVGAVNVDLLTFPMPNNSTVLFYVRLVANDTGNIGGGMVIQGSVTRGGGSTALDTSVVTANMMATAILAAGLNLVVVGTDTIVRFTGVAARTIRVMARIEAKVYTP